MGARRRVQRKAGIIAIPGGRYIIGRHANEPVIPVVRGSTRLTHTVHFAAHTVARSRSAALHHLRQQAVHHICGVRSQNLLCFQFRRGDLAAVARLHAGITVQRGERAPVAQHHIRARQLIGRNTVGLGAQDHGAGVVVLRRQTGDAQAVFHKAVDIPHACLLAHAHGDGVDALCQCVHHENIILGIGLAEIGGPILQLACFFILQLPHGRVQKRRGPVDLVFFQRQRIRADGLHGAAHLAGHGAAVQPAAHLFFPDAAHNGFQAAVVAHAHHCSLGRLDDVLPDGIAVFIPGDGAVLIVFRGLRCHTQPAGGEKAAVSALQRVFHHRLQVRVHRGVNAQAAVVQQIGRLGAVQAILLRKSGGHIRQHLVGEIGRDRRFRHRHIARRKADGLGRGGIVLFLGNIALLPHLVQNVIAAAQMLFFMGARVVPVRVFGDGGDGGALGQR